MLTVATLVATSAPAGAAEKDLRQQQSEVRRQRAAAAARVNTLTATTQELERSLQTLNANVREQDAKLTTARQAAAAAERLEADLRERVRLATEHLAELRAGVRDLAVRTYMRPLSADVKAGPRDIADVARAEVLLRAYTQKRVKVLDAFRVARVDLDAQLQARADAAQEARRRTLATEARFREVAAARNQQRTFATSAEARLEGALAEAAALASLDRNLSAQITRQQAGLASSLKGSGTSAGRLSTAKVPLTTVRGITVASSIAPQVAALLDASVAAGLKLGGGGYRDSAEQVALRRAHCGTSNYDVYEKPASECSPPTARPGYSMHEQGLAIDFTNNGSLITSQSDPAFVWLAANAGRYGLYNLPSEPWHWSTTGN